jgi:hypothetical protein
MPVTPSRFTCPSCHAEVAGQPDILPVRKGCSGGHAPVRVLGGPPVRVLNLCSSRTWRLHRCSASHETDPSLAGPGLFSDTWISNTKGCV